MNLFNFFNKKEKPDMTIALPISELTQSSTIESKENGVSQDSESNRPLTVSYATGWPIDIIYGYLHKNYEEKGFEDAMVKSDLTFRDMNLNIIRNKILMVFREINLNYDVLKNELETRIANCNAAGLLTTVSEIERNIAIVDTHRAELQKLESDFRNNTNEASIPLQSYECGFLRGISTIALSVANRTGRATSFSRVPSQSDIKITA